MSLDGICLIGLAEEQTLGLVKGIASTHTVHAAVPEDWPVTGNIIIWEEQHPAKGIHGEIWWIGVWSQAWIRVKEERTLSGKPIPLFTGYLTTTAPGALAHIKQYRIICHIRSPP